MPTLVLDSIDFLNCSDGCNEKKLTQTKTAFDDFVGELIDKHIAADFYSEKYKLKDAACGLACGKGQKIPGGFVLPKGYNGVSHEILMFDVAYCDLAKKLDSEMNETNPNIIEEITIRWKSVS